jgi:hypothetical protein
VPKLCSKSNRKDKLQILQPPRKKELNVKLVLHVEVEPELEVLELNTKLLAIKEKEFTNLVIMTITQFM